jgi:penicillin-binding protein 1C
LKGRLKILLITAGVLTTPVLLSPLPRFHQPLSTVVRASDGSLLGARIADDGQWRFPHSESLPSKFEKALLTFEDRWFRYHPGINPVSLGRAAYHNIRKGEIVSGGSTITMQVARLARGNPERTYSNKLSEILSALKLELFRSKKKILAMYASNAPFGGNTVGLEAAAWRYTGKPASSLSWAEAASLAILPNAPGLVHPGRNQAVMKKKRDDLLQKLFNQGNFDSLTLVLSLDEPLPGEPQNLPRKAPHLTDHFTITAKGTIVITTIDPLMQERATEIINSHQKDLASNFIFNSACIIIEVSTGDVLAYVGNSRALNPGGHGSDVDIIRSERSTGSILKPFLYAGMQQSGDILPNTLLADVPTRFPGFSPKNFDLTYSGAVNAGTALSQSLNIPAVKMLQQYNPEKFLALLERTGFTTFTKPADHYGLSIILGGGETSLWELAGAYASLSRVLNRYLEEGCYYSSDYHPPVLISSPGKDTLMSPDLSPPLSASAIWLTYEALRKVNRPETEAGWQYFSSAPFLAWKTGTSFGFRDGWAVGTTPHHVIGVWVGNAGGEGRPGLTGISAAAPVLFDLVNLIPRSSWFSAHPDDLTMIEVCAVSGYRAGPDCSETMEIPAHLNGLRSAACPFHRIIHLNRTGSYRVTADCESPAEIRSEPWFVLPPAMEYFYRKKHPEYRTLPPVAPGCQTGLIPSMEFIYPTPGTRIFIPRDQSGTRTRIVAEIAHRDPSGKIFWHLDESYVATTRSVHQVDLNTGPGSHILTAVDEDGNSIRCNFVVMN